VVLARQLIEVPDGIASEDAACAPISFGTAQHMLFCKAQLSPGESVLIHAAGSGIGSSAVKLAKLAGARVIATVGSDSKVEKARSIGADEVINYSKVNFAHAVKQLTQNAGVDVVFEHTGAATWTQSLLSLKKSGRVVICGATSGAIGRTDLLMLFNRQLTIKASFGCSIGDVVRVLEKMCEFKMSPKIDSIIEFGQVPEALDRIRNRQIFGKIVVRIP
jgi:NADPH:quinone reductase-like Zn-dependent oxidoreductase